MSATKLKHNGANTNLYCDGRTHIVHGCPACDKSYQDIMRPRWARARELCVQLIAAGMSDLKYSADLWKICASGIFCGRVIHVEERNNNDRLPMATFVPDRPKRD